MDSENEKKVPWLMVYLVTGCIDVGQILIDFTGIGALANEVIIDPAVGIILGLYFWMKGVMNMTASIAFIIAVLGKEGTLGVMPAWTPVVIYVHMQTIRSKAKATVIDTVSQKSKPLNQEGVRSPNREQALNQGNVRPPKL